MQSVSVLGAGALGLLYASHWAKAGVKVELLLRADQISRFAQGIGCQDQPRLAVTLRSLDAPGAPISHLLLATKATQAASALTPWLVHLSDDAQLLMIQNGLGSQQQVAALLKPTQTLLAASVTEGAYRSPADPALVVHAGRGETRLGVWSGAQAISGVETWVGSLQQAGLSASAVTDILPVLWEKLLINDLINPLTAWHQVPNGELLRRDLETQWLALLDELGPLLPWLPLSAPAKGWPARIREVLTATAANQSSMWQDRLAGRPTEVDFIILPLLEAAQQRGLSLPRHQALWQAIRQGEWPPPAD